MDITYRFHSIHSIPFNPPKSITTTKIYKSNPQRPTPPNSTGQLFFTIHYTLKDTAKALSFLYTLSHTQYSHPHYHYSIKANSHINVTLIKKPF